MATVSRICPWLVVLICALVSCQAFVINERIEEGEQTMINEVDMMTTEEEAEIDAMFPDQMRDDLKLELILKALTILKAYEGHSVSLTGWFPSYDVMPEELKLRLILKALVLLKDRPLDSTFAGHIIAQLKLTLTLKAISILKNNQSDFNLTVDRDDLKLALLLKAINILEVYDGELEDTVFFTESKKQLKLALILKAIELLKRGNWPINIDDLWSMVEEDDEEVPEGGQSETTTPEERTTAEEATPRPVTMAEEATSMAEEATPRPVTMEANGGGADEATRKPWIKKGISKVFKFFKWVPKILHKKKHLIFH